MNILVPTPGGLMSLTVDVVPEDVPLLIGLDVMERHTLQALTVENKLENVSEGWKMPTVRRDVHVVLQWPPRVLSVFYTRPQLQRLHRHLMHPSAKKRFELLRRADPNQLEGDTLSVLQDISQSCESCTLFSKRQLVFQVRDADQVRFNQQITFDVMFLKDSRGKQRPVLHVVDLGTKFSAAAFLPKSDVATVWNTFIKIWASAYIGFPESMLTDQGSVFLSKEWAYNCESVEISLRHTGNEIHNSLGAGEKYQSTLRTIYQKVRTEHTTVPPDVALALSVKAMNDTVDPHGLVPSLLVFGVLPKLPSVSPLTSLLRRNGFVPQDVPAQRGNGLSPNNSFKEVSNPSPLLLQTISMHPGILLMSTARDSSTTLGHTWSPLSTARTLGCTLVLHYNSFKSTRVTRSSMAGETPAFVEAFDNARIIQHDLERMLGAPLPLLMLTDSQALFDVITRSRYTTEKRLMIDISAAREAYREKLVSNLARIRSEYNPADSLTKIGGNDALSLLLKSHRITHPIIQYVVEPTTA